MMKAIIYYSLSGNTKKELEERYTGDHFRIESKGRLPKRLFCQLFWLGFLSSFNISPKQKDLDIDFDKYDEIVLGSPVWAFTITPFMRHFLKNNQFKNKKVTLLITCGGNPGKGLNDYKKRIDPSNEIVDEVIVKTGNVGNPGTDK
jgi:flavodoxin